MPPSDSGCVICPAVSLSLKMPFLGFILMLSVRIRHDVLYLLYLPHYCLFLPIFSGFLVVHLGRLWFASMETHMALTIEEIGEISGWAAGSILAKVNATSGKNFYPFY